MSVEYYSYLENHEGRSNKYYEIFGIDDGSLFVRYGSLSPKSVNTKRYTANEKTFWRLKDEKIRKGYIQIVYGAQYAPDISAYGLSSSTSAPAPSNQTDNKEILKKLFDTIIESFNAILEDEGESVGYDIITYSRSVTDIHFVYMSEKGTHLYASIGNDCPDLVVIFVDSHRLMSWDVDGEKIDSILEKAIVGSSLNELMEFVDDLSKTA